MAESRLAPSHLYGVLRAPRMPSAGPGWHDTVFWDADFRKCRIQMLVVTDALGDSPCIIAAKLQQWMWLGPIWFGPRALGTADEFGWLTLEVWRAV